MRSVRLTRVKKLYGVPKKTFRQFYRFLLNNQTRYAQGPAVQRVYEILCKSSITRKCKFFLPRNRYIFLFTSNDFSSQKPTGEMYVL